MIIRVLLGIGVGLVVNEFCDVSPWLARKIARWSAFHRYSDPARAAARAEELAAVINDRPGKLFKLITACGFAAAAGLNAGHRHHVEQTAITELERSAVVSALRRLPTRQREVLVLRYYADLSETQIASTMGISRQAVMIHKARGMSSLRTALITPADR